MVRVANERIIFFRKHSAVLLSASLPPLPINHLCSSPARQGPIFFLSTSVQKRQHSVGPFTTVQPFVRLRQNRDDINVSKEQLFSTLS